MFDWDGFACREGDGQGDRHRAAAKCQVLSSRQVSRWQGSVGVAGMEYEIRVAGEVPPETLAELGEAHLTRQGVETILRGPVVDQAALVGIVNWLQMLGIELREIRQAGSDRPDVESTDDPR